MTSLFDDEHIDAERGLEFGDSVTIHYVTKTLEGGVLERSHGREPLQFRIGAPEIVPGLSEALIGRSVGDHVSVRLAPDKSFGHRRSDWQIPVPLTELPEKVAVGDQLQVITTGEAFPAWVQKVTGTDAVLDANHPLADETTLVEVDIVSMQPSQPELPLSDSMISRSGAS